MTGTCAASVLLGAMTVPVLAPPRAVARVPVRPLDQLNRRLAPGDTFWVTDAQGPESTVDITESGRLAATLSGQTRDGCFLLTFEPVWGDPIAVLTQAPGGDIVQVHAPA